MGVCGWDLGLPPASSVALGQVTLAPSCSLPHWKLGRDATGPKRTRPGPGVETSWGTLPSPNSSLISRVTPTRTEIGGSGGVAWWLTSLRPNKGSPTSNEGYRHRFIETDTSTRRGGSLPEFTGQIDGGKVQEKALGPRLPPEQGPPGHPASLPGLTINTSATLQRHLIHSPQTCPFRPVPSYRLSVPRRKSGQLLTWRSAAPLCKGPSRGKRSALPGTCHVVSLTQICVAPGPDTLGTSAWHPLPSSKC